MHGGAPGSGAPIGNTNALRHGHYTAAAIARRRQLSELIRTARATLANVEEQSWLQKGVPPLNSDFVQPAVIPKRFGGPHFRDPRAPQERTRISLAGTASSKARELMKQANRPADEPQLRRRPSADHPVCWSATGPSSHGEPTQ
jgi:hypothetical protein